MRVVFILAAAAALAGCATPAPQIITRPVYIDRVTSVIQPLPPELLADHSIAEGSPSQCPAVAAQRRAELVACNADKAALRAIAGQQDQDP